MRKFNLINIRNDRQFRAFTGLPESLFNRLLPVFVRSLKLAQEVRDRNRHAPRRRCLGGGRKGALPTPELKLFFLLFYLKTYPTFDVLGSLFDLSPSKAEEQIQKLLPILKQAEKQLEVLPDRHFKPANKEEQHIENNQKIIVDATERPLCRPQHARKQKNYYSGKSHLHALKNTIVSNINQGVQGIQVVGPTTPGRQHDYASFKKEFNPEQPGLSSVRWYGLIQGIKALKKTILNLKRFTFLIKSPGSQSPILIRL